MYDFIGKIFAFLATVFDKIPLVNKVKGFRTIVGFVGFAVVAGLKAYGVLQDEELIKALEYGLAIWTGLALNAKGRE